MTYYCRAFYLGFHSVCASNALFMLRPEEVEQLVCGSQVRKKIFLTEKKRRTFVPLVFFPQVFDLNELRKVTYYDGYKAEDATIRHFWQVIKKALLSRQESFYKQRKYM